MTEKLKNVFDCDLHQKYTSFSFISGLLDPGSNLHLSFSLVFRIVLSSRIYQQQKNRMAIEPS